jgi:hypothetical protein
VIDASWLAAMTQLDQLVLEGFVLSDADLDLVTRKQPPLESLLFTSASFDMESSAVWLVSRRRAALEEVRELVGELDVDGSADVR